MQIQRVQELTIDTAGQDVVDVFFGMVIEGAIDIAEQGKGDVSRMWLGDLWLGGKGRAHLQMTPGPEEQRRDEESQSPESPPSMRSGGPDVSYRGQPALTAFDKFDDIAIGVFDHSDRRSRSDLRFFPGKFNILRF